MIKIKIRPEGIRMDGHANCSINGQDIVCAAVSALTCNLINVLHDLAKEQIRADMDSGMTVIAWQKLSDKGKLLVDAWFLGIAAINQEYNCIEFV